jgi:hypothetical protein
MSIGRLCARVHAGLRVSLYRAAIAFVSLAGVPLVLAPMALAQAPAVLPADGTPFPQPSPDDLLAQSPAIRGLIARNQIAAINRADPFMVVVLNAGVTINATAMTQLCQAIATHFGTKGFAVTRALIVIKGSTAQPMSCKGT